MLFLTISLQGITTGLSESNDRELKKLRYKNKNKIDVLNTRIASGSRKKESVRRNQIVKIKEMDLNQDKLGHNRWALLDNYSGNTRRYIIRLFHITNGKPNRVDSIKLKALILRFN